MAVVLQEALECSTDGAFVLFAEAFVCFEFGVVGFDRFVCGFDVEHMGYGLWVVGCGLWVVGYGLLLVLILFSNAISIFLTRIVVSINSVY